MAPALPAALRRPVAGIALVAAVAAGWVGAVYAGDRGPGRVDAWVDGMLPPARPGALVIDFLGEPTGAAAVVAALTAACLVLGRRRLAALAVAAPVGSAAATTAVKPVVERTINGVHLAYPSGHTALLTAAALVLALLAVDLLRAGRLAGLLLVLAATCAAGAAMAWSQVTLGAHYPTDTLGGFCTAVAVTVAVGLLIDRVADALARRRAT